MDTTLLENKYLFFAVSAIGGMVVTLATQKILNRSGLLSYFVNHIRVGVSAVDEIFGTVKVTWNDTVIKHLYLSTVELVNESLKDYENVVVRVFSSDTNLLTHKTEIVGTTRILNMTEEYCKEIQVASGKTPTDAQREIYWGRRDYLVPTMNRGQVLRFQYLNAAKTDDPPTIWLEVIHKGLKVKFRNPQPMILGVPHTTAALIGGLLGLMFVVCLIIFVKTLWIVAISSFIFGYLVIIPGAYFLKACKWMKDFMWG